MNKYFISYFYDDDDGGGVGNGFFHLPHFDCEADRAGAEKLIIEQTKHKQIVIMNVVKVGYSVAPTPLAA